MGPQPFSRGNTADELRLQGPATLQWGRNLSVAETGRARTRADFGPRASMGPQPFSRRNDEAISWMNSPEALQWGRNLSVAETLTHVNPSHKPSVASMGPQPFSRGNVVGRLLIQLPQQGFNGAATFQSRKPAVGRRGGFSLTPLQWGRNLSVAETTIERRAGASSSTSFNGAATFQSRKLGEGANRG